MKTINIEIPVADLKPVLPGFSKIIGKRTSLPVLGCVKVSLNPDKSLHIQGTNSEQFVTVRLNKQLKGNPGVMLVPLDELTSVVKLCANTDTIELVQAGKETVISYPAAGTVIKKSVLHVEAKEFSEELIVNEEPIKLDETFKQALAEAFDCASTDSGRYVLNGACLDVTNKEAHYVVATDRRHLFSANSFLFDVPESIILPHGRFLTWSGFVEDGPWQLRYQPEIKGKGKNYTGAKRAVVRLDSDHWTFVTNPIEGLYPNWKQIVPEPKSIKSTITLGEPGIETILNALPRLPGSDSVNQPVTLEIMRDGLNLKAENKTGNWIVIPVPAKVSGRPDTACVNRTLLAKALKFGCTEIAIAPPDESHARIILSTKGKTMVICQIKPDPDPAKGPVPAPQPPPNNNAAAETPSPAQPEPETEERNKMPVQSNELAAPQRGNLTSHTPDNETSALDEAMEKIDSIKSSVRQVLDDLGEADKLLKKVVKDQKSSEKEINRARNALKSLQNVEI